MCQDPKHKMKNETIISSVSEDMDTMLLEEKTLDNMQAPLMDENMLKEQQRMKDPASVYDLSFGSIWKEDTADFLHKLALKKDVKNKEINAAPEDITEEIQASREETETKLSELKATDTKRSEKTRRNHLTKAAKGFEKASVALKKMQAERSAIDENENLSDEKRSEKIMGNTDKAEAAIRLMFESQINSVMATGNDDKSEMETIEALKTKRTLSILNLYRQQAANPSLLAKDKETLMKKVSRLMTGVDTTATRLFFAGSRVLRDYSRYNELGADEVVKMVDKNRFNKENAKKVYGFLDKNPTGEESLKTKYICSFGASRFNKYIRYQEDKDKLNLLRIKVGENSEEYKEFQKNLKEEAKELGKELSRIEVNDVNAWMGEAEKLKASLDVATKLNKLDKKAKFYRMVDPDILSWGFGLTYSDRSMSPAEIVEKLNKKAGMGFEDKSVMSVGWKVDYGFRERPVMLTLLTEKGKKCFVTRNYKESEVIFGRNTRYMFVEAINHTGDIKRMKTSPNVADNETNAAKMESESANFGFAGIELVMKVLPSDEEEWNEAAEEENRIQREVVPKIKTNADTRAEMRKKASDNMK